MKSTMVVSGRAGKHQRPKPLFALGLTLLCLLSFSQLKATDNAPPPVGPGDVRFTEPGEEKFTESVLATITGRVTNSSGEGIQGASIRVKGSATGTSTDSAGNFTITIPDGAVLEISSIGYETQEVPTAGRTTIEVVLLESNKELEQVIVVGYGTQRKIDVTGSVATVRGEEISKQPSINPISGLQGKVAGVQITNAGAPGASPQIRIRGLGTVYGSANLCL